MKNHVLAALAVLTTIALASCGAPSTPDFVQKVAMSDMYEVDRRREAIRPAYVEAHTQTTEELKGIVQAQSIKVDLPAKLDEKHQRLIDDLNAAHAEDFDKTYAKQQVSAHDKAEELFEKYAEKGDDAAVKAFAAKTLPVIKQHQEAAKKLS
jgi:putative membrane protein